MAIPHGDLDGITFAKATHAKDKFENLGARLVWDVVQQTNEMASDDTTMATVLARAFYSDGVTQCVAAGCNSMDLRHGSQAAWISTNGDSHVSSLIAQAMEKIGKEGVITVKVDCTTEDKIEITEGMWFAFFLLHYRSQVEFEKPYVLFSEKISLLYDILPLPETAGKPFARCSSSLRAWMPRLNILNKLYG
ncbi:hypothetical protein EI94DRAFT_1816392 [Lactarius quietus]|nr:hypothetical protein EI94DRAFT_1816392 [Lactarius quietus]